MIEPVTLSLGVIQIIVQLTAAYLAYRLLKITGAFLGWSLVVTALALMTARRVTALMIEMGSITELRGYVAFTDRIILPLAISLLLMLAMYKLVRAFEQHVKTR